MSNSYPVALTIAGSDSSSGAGMQADLKTFAAHRVYGVNALTAVVAEVPGEVARFDATDPILLEHQLNSVVSHFPVSAAKTGMLANAENVKVTATFAKSHPHLALVVDPVIYATAESKLLSDEGLELVRRDLLPCAQLATPNLPEAEALLGRDIESQEDLALAPRELSDLYGCDFLVKGGHFEGDSETITDYAWINGEPVLFSHPRINVGDTHGTGCTLSAAITANLASGKSLRESVRRGIDYLTRSLASQHRWRHGGGTITALNHFPNEVD